MDHVVLKLFLCHLRARQSKIKGLKRTGVNKVQTQGDRPKELDVQNVIATSWNFRVVERRDID